MGTALCQKYVPFRLAIRWVITPSSGVILGQAHFRGTRHSVDPMERGQKVRKRARKGPPLPAAVLGLARASLSVSVHKVLPH